MITKIEYNDLSDEIKSFLSGSNGRGGTFYVDDYIVPGETDNWQSIQNAINDAEAVGGGGGRAGGSYAGKRRRCVGIYLVASQR